MQAKYATRVYRPEAKWIRIPSQYAFVPTDIRRSPPYHRTVFHDDVCRATPNRHHTQYPKRSTDSFGLDRPLMYLDIVISTEDCYEKGRG